DANKVAAHIPAYTERICIHQRRPGVGTVLRSPPPCVKLTQRTAGHEWVDEVEGRHPPLHGVERDREGKVSVCKVIAQVKSDFWIYAGSDDRPVVRCDDAIAIYIFNPYVAGFTECRYIVIPFLVYTVEDVVIVGMYGVPDKPVVCHHVVFTPIVIQIGLKQMDDGVFVVRECGVRTPFKFVSSYVDRIQGEFDTLIVDLADVGQDVIIACHGRDRAVHQQIMCIAVVRFNCTPQSTIEEVEVQRYVGGISRLPLKVVITHSSWIYTDGRASTIAIDIVRDGRKAKRLVRADRLVTRCTIGNPQ